MQGDEPQLTACWKRRATGEFDDIAPKRLMDEVADKGGIAQST